MGKGDKRRKEDFSKIQGNWEKIDWTPKKKPLTVKVTKKPSSK